MNEIMIKIVKGEKWPDEEFVIFFRQGRLTEPLFITTKTHAEKIAKEILGIKEE